MAFLRALIRPLVPRSVIGWRERRKLAALARTRSLPPIVSSAVENTVASRPTGEALAIIRRIEARREKLLDSRDQVEVLDFGAGHRGVSRTSEEMARGTVERATVGGVCHASKPPVWARLLFELIRAGRPVTCLEMGTSLGISASYIAAALQLNGGGRLLTLEGAPALAQLAKRNFTELGLGTIEVRIGAFQDSLPVVLRELAPLDFVLIDGHHDEEATKRYFAMIRPRLAADAIVVFDDINWSAGMQRAWREIAGPRDQASDLGELGIWINHAGRASTEPAGRPEKAFDDREGRWDEDYQATTTERR